MSNTMRQPNRLLARACLFLSISALVKADLSLPELQPITGFSEECTAAYSTPISQCRAAERFMDGGATMGCSRDCFVALNDASLAIQAACQSSAAFGNTVISHAFEGDLSVFLCGNAFSDGSNDSTASNIVSTPLPPNPTSSQTSKVTSVPTPTSTSSSESDDTSSETTLVTSTISSDTGTDSSTSTSMTITSPPSTTSSSRSPISASPAPSTTRFDSTPFDQGVTAEGAASSIRIPQGMWAAYIGIMLGWLFSFGTNTII